MEFHTDTPRLRKIDQVLFNVMVRRHLGDTGSGFETRSGSARQRRNAWDSTSASANSENLLDNITNIYSQ